MATCPNCQTENDADFGLVNCISCGKPFLIEIDGDVRATEEMPAADLSALPAHPEGAPAAELTNILMEDLSSSDAVIGHHNPAPADFFGAPSDGLSGASPDPHPLPDVPASMAAIAVTEAHAASKENLADMREVAAFGNSDVSLAREGAYRFNLSIYGIDSADIRDEVKDALTDARFLWDLESLFSQIEEGVLKLNDLSAVKSALIVQRLKTLPVDIKWEQYAIHQP